ncbi:hypothetical protein CRV08_10760 [Halarcobacter ebronensis]|uniref:Carbamoyltransferase n=1 Tax=Halarcobacter ebronensis TaxID=1462615 RepID=A0A4Q0YEX7_9BACT|nr:carbamoyltransferase C-terminal domain-containing protein [Halarcobacter ebronensis]RXJ67401.1 hypothetical protein CRV08_10760 [Halarcobacter ebronensis]
MNDNELILGLGIFGHDSSVSLIEKETGKILYCLTEERFSNIKHDGNFPYASMKNVLDIVKQDNLGKIKYIALNIDKSLFFKKIVEFLKINLTDKNLYKDILSVLEFAINEVEMQIFYDNVYPINFIKAKLIKSNITDVEDIVDHIIWNGNFILKYKRLIKFIQAKFPDAKVYEVPHHICHAASTIFCSDFKETACITIDGQGEIETITLNYYNNKNLEVISSSLYPNSLGSLYMHLTWYLGFDGHPKYPGFTDEFKVMGMSAYGESKYLEIFRTFGDINSEGKFEVNFGEFIELVKVNGCRGHYEAKFTEKFYTIFGPRRNSNESILQKHYDIARSFQQFIEEIGVKLAKFLKNKIPNTKNICLAGGVALNGLMNMKILNQAGFENIFIQPASGDDGTSLGAALYIRHILTKSNMDDIQFTNAYLGLQYNDIDIEKILKKFDINFTKPSNIHKEIGKLLNQGKIITRYYGRAEFGPRALGHRSILANPAIPNMKEIINKKIKHREPFRPFAPACLEEEVSEYFDIKVKAPYMILICEALRQTKDIAPSIVHDDNTARLQSVSKIENEDFYKIISEFYKLSGVPIVINTSFNVNGEVIVETPLDALESALFMDVDYLAIGSYLVSINDNKDKKFLIERQEFLKKRKLRYVNDYFSEEMYFWTEDNPIEVELEITNKQLQMYKNVAEERLKLINELHNQLNSKKKIKFWQFIKK